MYWGIAEHDQLFAEFIFNNSSLHNYNGNSGKTTWGFRGEYGMEPKLL